MQTYSQQLQHVHENLRRKHCALINRRNVVLLLENKRPYSARIMQEKISNLDWSVLLYSPDFAPRNFYLFCSMQNAINDKKDHVKTLVENFLTLKLAEFYLRRTNKLPDKWQELVQYNREFTIDWNWFIVKLFRNKSYLTKTEIIYAITRYLFKYDICF